MTDHRALRLLSVSVASEGPGDLTRCEGEGERGGRGQRQQLEGEMAAWLAGGGYRGLPEGWSGHARKVSSSTRPPQAVAMGRYVGTGSEWEGAGGRGGGGTAVPLTVIACVFT